MRSLIISTVSILRKWLKSPLEEKRQQDTSCPRRKMCGSPLDLASFFIPSESDSDSSKFLSQKMTFKLILQYPAETIIASSEYFRVSFHKLQ